MKKKLFSFFLNFGKFQEIWEGLKLKRNQKIGKKVMTNKGNN